VRDEKEDNYDRECELNIIIFERVSVNRVVRGLGQYNPNVNANIIHV